MDKITKRITTSSTWAASSDLAAVDLPRDGLITEVTIRANITATLTATAVDDWLRRVIQNIKIEGDGGRAYLGMSGDQMSRLLSLWGEVLGLGPTLHSNGGGIALAAPDVGSASFRSLFKFHPGSNPRDPFDLTAAIPARALSMLQTKLTTTANSVCDANGTISAGTFNYEVCEVLGLPVPQGLMTPVGSTLAYAHTANYSDFSYDIDIPAGAFLRSIIMLIQDDTATVSRRKDDEVTGVKIKRPKTGDYILEQTIYELKQAMMARYGIRAMSHDVGPIGAIATTRPAPGAALAVVPAGFVIIDLRAFAAPENGISPLYGLDLRPFQTGDFKLGLTIENYASGDDTIIYWDQLLPVDANLVGR
mgnify:CR=1 FL=1